MLALVGVGHVGMLLAKVLEGDLDEFVLGVGGQALTARAVQDMVVLTLRLLLGIWAHGAKGNACVTNVPPCPTAPLRVSSMSELEFILPCPAPGSGSYRYTLNGEPTEVEEHFEVAATKGGWRLESTRTAPGSTRLHAEASGTGDRDSTCTLTFSSDEIAETIALYELAGGSLTVSMNGEAPRAIEADVYGAAVLSPLLRVFQGPTVAETIRAGGRRPVLIPRLDPGDPASLLTPLVEIRTAEPLGAEAVGEGEEETLWRHCRYVGGNYDDQADFWLDERDRLVRYRFPQAEDQLWEVELVE